MAEQTRFRSQRPGMVYIFCFHCLRYRSPIRQTQAGIRCSWCFAEVSKTGEHTCSASPAHCTELCSCVKTNFFVIIPGGDQPPVVVKENFVCSSCEGWRTRCNANVTGTPEVFQCCWCGSELVNSFKKVLKHNQQCPVRPTLPTIYKECFCHLPPLVVLPD